MTFDSIVLAAVASELNRGLLNGSVDGIHQPSPLDIVFTIRSNGANHMLLISADAQSPRIHLTAVKRPNPKTPPNFCMLLRKYLGGARLTGIEQVDFDRILHLKFAACDGERFTLVVELMGKHSNIILINDTHRILGAVKIIGRQKNRYREIVPGRQYISPPSQGKVNPLLSTRGEFDALLAAASPGDTPDPAEAASWLVKTFTGISPFAARELMARSDGDLTKLSAEFDALFQDVRAGKLLPVLITDDSGRTTGFYAFPSLQHPASNQHERSSISTAADAYYTSALPRQAFDHAKEEFVRRLQGELHARERALGEIRDGIAQCEGAEMMKRIGEMILSQIASISGGADSAELIDYYDPEGRPVAVELNPQMNAQENAEAYFKRYHKAASGAEALRDRLAETEAQIRLLRKVLDSTSSITSEGQIRELTDILQSQGIRTAQRAEQTLGKRKPEFDGHRITRVISDGWEILVGQNSQANDYLVMRVARPTDLWVHVKASPSAHVVIRTNGKPDAVPRGVLHHAAELAARHSDSKHSSLVPVDYTLRKYVRKPKGSPSGKVIYQNEKTVYITPTG